jgi:hypothetical protein
MTAQRAPKGSREDPSLFESTAPGERVSHAIDVEQIRPDTRAAIDDDSYR